MTDKLKEAREDFVKSANECNYSLHKMCKSIDALKHFLTPLTDAEIEGLKRAIFSNPQLSYEHDRNQNHYGYNQAIDDIKAGYWLIKK